MYVCICHALTDADVKSAEAKGAADESGVFSQHGIQPKCGNCLHAMRCLLSELKNPCGEMAPSEHTLIEPQAP